MNLPEEDLRKICDWAARLHSIKEIHLFGSRARGDSKDNSDIDLAIIPSIEDPNEALAWWIELTLPELFLSSKVDLQLCHNSLTDIVYAAVQKDGFKIWSVE